MNSLKINNLKCLNMQESIPIKPITVLLGNNSSGKSTFLRTFPLFQQSLEAETQEPLLWYGEYVDFGNFNTSLRREATPEIISFEYSTGKNDFKNKLNHHIYVSLGYLHRVNLNVEDIKVKFEISRKDKDISYISFIKVSFFDQSFSIKFKNNLEVLNFEINDKTVDFIKNTNKIKAITSRNSFFPDRFSESENLKTNHRRVFDEAIFNNVKNLVNKKTSDSSIYKIISRLNLNYNDKMLEMLKSDTSELNSWNKNVSKWTINSQDYIKIKNSYIFSLIPFIMQLLNEHLNSLFSNTYYIAPIRATAERYYRRQGLSIEKVDFQGRNLALFLESMNGNEKTRFQNWVYENFNFTPKTQASEGHISMIITENENEDYNIADKGFGYSQLLPIITQLWVASQRKNLKQNLSYYRNRKDFNTVFITIEQPELHLHPRLQARLADCFIKAIHEAKKNNVNLKIIIETHSETIINRFGHKIAQGKINNDDISIGVFNHNKTNCTSTQLGKYDEEGFLTNWPLGFFDPEED